jgi:ABC-type dipeptide/oligopeptide/nickel transport system permease subunit
MADSAHERSVVRRLLASRSGSVGLTLAAAFVLLALGADLLAPYQPTALVAEPFLPASAEHWLGTDGLGRDVLSRVIHGSRLSLLAGAVSTALAIGVGGLAGAIAGYRGGWVDVLVMRGVDVLLAFPSILVALAVIVALEPGWIAVIVAVGLINVPLACRQIRAATLSLREQEYVLAARAAGASPTHLLLRVLLPGLSSTVIVLATLGLGTAILEVAGLAFLGVAGQIDVAEWGSMLNAAKETLRSSPWPAIAPGAAISLAVLGFSLLGDALRDACEPRPSGPARS